MDLETALGREWLATNGLGGYALGTVAGIPTRTYHGLLVTAVRPPVGRVVRVAGLLETLVEADGTTIELHAIERADGTFLGDGWDRLVEARSEGSRTALTYDLGARGRLEKLIWMAHERDTTYVRYELTGSGSGVATGAATAAATAAGGPVTLRLTPLLTRRDHHTAATSGSGEDVGRGVRTLVAGARHEAVGEWVRGIRLREETARGLVDATDAFARDSLVATLAPGRPVTLVLTAERDDPEAPDVALAASRARDDGLLAAAAAASVGAVGSVGADAALAPSGAAASSAFGRRLVIAADAFIVQRSLPGVSDGRSVIAGYPWFADWGRDTMIALPGLCLATGRQADAAMILRSFAAAVRDGLVPNDFPDDPAVEPAYHTIDASLWFVRAIHAYSDAAGDRGLLADLLPTARGIVDAHIAGTRFGIGMDPADGLLRGGADGVQLTWMDAKVDDWVVTPRRGKPVEIQALWVNALRDLAAWTGVRSYGAIADTASTSFTARFWRPDLGYLADVVDGPDGDDDALRPNQLLALSLPYPLVDATIGRSVLAAVERELVVPLGLRSLAPTDPAYRSRFQGDRRTRDAAYHQGTVWTWLIGPYLDAVVRFGGGRAAALARLEPFGRHLDEAGLGSVSEVLEPEPPFTPRGCPFQAWSVAELLRTWTALSRGTG